MGDDFGMWRVEGEACYRKNDVDRFQALGVEIQGEGDADALSLMANGYINFENQTKLTPFIGAGIGFAEVCANDWSIAGISIGSENDTVFADQIGLGATYSATQHVMLDLSYKYFAASDPEFQTT